MLPHLGKEKGLHLGKLLSVVLISGKIDQFGISLAMLFQKLIGILLQVKELGLTHRAIQDIILDELPIAQLHTAHPRLGPT